MEHLYLKKRKTVGKFTGNSSLMKIEDTINEEQLIYFITNSTKEIYTRQEVLNIIAKFQEFKKEKSEKFEFNYLS